MRKIRLDRVVMVVILLGLIIMTFLGISILKEQNKQSQEMKLRELKKKEIMPIGEFIEMIDKTIEKNNKLTYLGDFRLTGYCDCVECQEEWVGTTAIGVKPTINHTIAVDPDVIPLHSHVMINGQEYVAEDVGGMINNNHIDIFVGSHEECYSDYCNGYAEVYLIND